MKKLSNWLQGLALVALCLVGSHSWAAARGQVNFDDLSQFYGQPKVEINLSAQMLGFVKQAGQDPDMNKALENIENISVRVYSLNDDPKHAVSTLQEVAGRIKKANWQPMVTVREEGQDVQIFSKMENDKMAGLVVMVVDSTAKGEAVFINIVGEIDPSQLSNVFGSLNLDVGTPQ